jgi:glutamyl-tRNA reductase
VQLAASALDGLAGRRVLVIGAGEAAELAARALAARGVDSLVCCSRTEAHARELAVRTGGRELLWEHLAAGLATADVVISATSAPEPVVCAEQLALLRSGGRPLVLVDLAVPHDVEPDVATLPGVRLYGLEDLRSVADEGLARRMAAAPAVEAIVEDELERFRRWVAGYEVAPVIVELRRHVHRAVHAEARAGLDRVGRGEASPEEALQRLAERITTKVLHVPVARLRERAALDDAEASIAVIRDLFAIDPAPDEEAA